MPEYIISELGKLIKQAIKTEIPKKLDKKDFEGVQRDCELVIGLMRNYFFHKLADGVWKGYTDFLDALENIASTIDGRNARLILQCLSIFYREIFLSISKPAQGK